MNQDSLNWAQKVTAIAQTGLHFSDNNADRYHHERYQQLLEIAQEMLAHASGANSEYLKEHIALENGYITPKIDVRAGIFRDNKILLVRELSDMCWTVPGGWADVGESPAEAITKEVREEAGFKVNVKKLVAILDQHKNNRPHIFHSYKALFHCKITDNAKKSDNETDRVDFFAQDELPKLSVGRISKEQIALFFEHMRNPTLATCFD